VVTGEDGLLDIDGKLSEDVLLGMEMVCRRLLRQEEGEEYPRWKKGWRSVESLAGLHGRPLLESIGVIGDEGGVKENAKN
jgi:hypothetical protein